MERTTGPWIVTCVGLSAAAEVRAAAHAEAARGCLGAGRRAL